MRQLPTGPTLVAAAAACAGIAIWAMRPAAPPTESKRARERATSASLALAPPYSRQSVRTTEDGSALDRKERAEPSATKPVAKTVSVSNEALRPTVDAAAPPVLDDSAARSALARTREARVLTALRAIAAAQAQLQGSARIDTDGDRIGEFGYLGELAGISPIRKHDPEQGAVAGGPEDVLEPALLSSNFAHLTSVGGRGVITLDGYHFAVFLPDASTTSPLGALAEAVTGGSGATLPGSDNAETLWCVYAWPVDVQGLPLRTFFTNQAGEVLACGGDPASPAPYAGSRAPRFDAALANTAPNDLRQPTSRSAVGQGANDGQAWTVVRD